MPITSPCDGDVLARCNVDKQVTPFVMGGYIQVRRLTMVCAGGAKLMCWGMLGFVLESQVTC